MRISSGLLHCPEPEVVGGTEEGRSVVALRSTPAFGRAVRGFVRTLGDDNREAEVCGDLLGVGFLPDRSVPPRIILLYNGGSFNSPGKDPVILAWDTKAKRYQSDDDAVRRLGNATTIPAIKEKLQALER